jgi:hypothetical protein
MKSKVSILGLVQGGRFRLSVPSGRELAYARLTTLQPEVAQPADSGEIDLTPYEGQALMVRGYDQGEWIYGAEIIDMAGPILTAVVERLSGLPPTRPG